MLVERQMTEFLFNIHDTNSIITGGRTSGGYYCPVNCTFCMCKGDNPHINSMMPFIEMEELKQGIRFIDWKKKVVYLGDGITKLSAEAFAHPLIYDILEYVCKNLPDHYVHIMTTGTLIREDRIDFLNSLKNLFISMSVNTLQESERKKIMPHPETEKIKVLLKRLHRLTKEQLLDMGSLDILQADIDELKRLNNSKGFQLRRIEHSKFHTDEVVALSKLSIMNYEKSVKFVQDNYPDSTYWTPYLRYELRNAGQMVGVFQYLKEVCEYLEKNRSKNYVFCASESSYELWSIWLRGFKNVRVELIKNETYGGSVTVAGLLTFDDVLMGLKDKKLTNVDCLILPKIMLNRAFADLNGKTIVEFHKEIGIYPIIL